MFCITFLGFPDSFGTTRNLFYVLTTRNLLPTNSSHLICNWKRRQDQTICFSNNWVSELSGEYWRKDLRFRTENWGFSVREKLCPWKMCHLPAPVNTDGITNQVAWQAKVCSLGGVDVPVFLCNFVHFSNTLHTGRLEKRLIE